MSKHHCSGSARAGRQAIRKQGHFMDCGYNQHVSLTGLQSEMLPDVGRISLCVRTQCHAFDKADEVQLQVLLDGYKPGTREFLSKSQIILSFSTSRENMLSMTDISMMARG
jgi:hypothetical protein